MGRGSFWKRGAPNDTSQAPSPLIALAIKNTVFSRIETKRAGDTQP